MFGCLMHFLVSSLNLLSSESVLGRWAVKGWFLVAGHWNSRCFSEYVAGQYGHVLSRFVYGAEFSYVRKK